LLAVLAKDSVGLGELAAAHQVTVGNSSAGYSWQLPCSKELAIPQLVTVGSSQKKPVGSCQEVAFGSFQKVAVDSCQKIAIVRCLACKRWELLKR